MKVALVMTFIGFCLTSRGSGLRCYECGMKGGPTCTEKAPLSQLKTCQSNDKFCGFANLTINGISRSRRLCSPTKINCDVVPKPPTSIVFSSSCSVKSCQIDGCNGSSRLEISLISFTAFLTITIFIQNFI